MSFEKILFDKLRETEERFDEIERLSGEADVVADPQRFASLMKERAAIETVALKFKEFREAAKAADEGEGLLEGETDDEFRRLIKEDIAENRAKADALTAELTALAQPKDADGDRNVIVEIRGGAGGDEAALFAGVLFRMYTRYAERRRWKSEVMSVSENAIGGFREIIFSVSGRGAYSRLRYESGVHRVQRVPVTEGSGRIHTSTVTVAVLPEADEVDVEVDPADVRVDVYRSSGHGGQNVNTTDSAVRLTHLPTGIVVTCQDEKSQLKNKDRAFKILRARILDAEMERRSAGLSAERKGQIGTGNRNERVRTYNFPQGRVTDHRIGLTIHRINDVIEGDLDEMADSLAAYYSGN